MINVEQQKENLEKRMHECMHEPDIVIKYPLSWKLVNNNGCWIFQFCDNDGNFFFGNDITEPEDAALIVKTVNSSHEKNIKLKKLLNSTYDVSSREKVMQSWDYYRQLIANGNRSSLPRDWFESIIDDRDEKILELERKIEHLNDNIDDCIEILMMHKKRGD